MKLQTAIFVNMGLHSAVPNTVEGREGGSAFLKITWIIFF